MIYTKKYLWLLFIGLLSIYFSQCSKLKKELPTEPAEHEAASHQTGWLDTLSNNFHGKYLRTHSWDLASCQKCHGNDYAGGSSGSSCLSSGCHSGTPESCTTCHGGALNQTGAPPKDIDNHYQTKFKGVGAHTALVTNPRWSRVYDCTECHLKPTKLRDPGHIDSDLPAEIVWGELAKVDNLSPVWKDSTCSNVYCHGASLSDGTLKSFVWTQPGILNCNGCHGIAPNTGAHKKHVETLQNDCNVCHDGYLKNVEVNKQIHIDGKRDVQMNATYGGTYANGICSNVSCHGSVNTPNWKGQAGLTCTSCHGGTDNTTGAPPVDLQGNASRTVRGVGAHTAHVSNSRWGQNYDCNQCHPKPVNINDPGHIDTSRPADVVWGDLSKIGNLAPNWDGSTCDNVYCHGASLKDGSANNPQWTQTQSLSCNACHGLPPGTGGHKEHDENQIDCNICHDGYSKNISVNKAVHVDGKNDIQLSASVGGSYANGVCSNVSCHGSISPNWTEQAEFTCTSCHGGTDNLTGAPPVDLQGNTSKAARGVGAHTAHMTDSQWGPAYDCNECHVKPANISDPGHIDVNRPADIVWGEFSKTGNLTPNWDGSKCENVYCHGGSLQDGSVKSPQWTRTQALPCDACHGIPPKNGAHEECVEESGFDCFVCHDGYSKESNKVNKDFHLNGKKDVILNALVGGSYKDGVCSNVICHGVADSPNWKQDAVLSCISCHGGQDNSTGAPPIDLKGNTQRTATGVGAHTAHISQSKFARAFYCDECHIKPSKISDQWHIDILPPAEITWGELAKTNQLNPEWNGTTCTNVYCHGNSLAGGTMVTPTWTSTESISCGFCHSLPPNTGKHELHVEDYSFDCNFCHDGYIKNSSINLQTHIDGKKDVQFSTAIGGSYANGVCSNVICHGAGNTPAWTSEAAEFNCVSCHGGLFDNTGAPPYDLKGDTTTTVKGVGAHTIHILGGTLSDGVECTECHFKPININDPKHIGIELLPAEITWGTLATNDGAVPAWNGVQTCQNVYCHGEFDMGNKENNPKWINFAGTQPCGSCHGIPPASPHPQVTQCSSCHSLVVDASNNIIAKDKHINGTTDFRP